MATRPEMMGRKSPVLRGTQRGEKLGRKAPDSTPPQWLGFPLPRPVLGLTYPTKNVDFKHQTCGFNLLYVYT